jgi:hypothetical protein
MGTFNVEEEGPGEMVAHRPDQVQDTKRSQLDDKKKEKQYSKNTVGNSHTASIILPVAHQRRRRH